MTARVKSAAVVMAAEMMPVPTDTTAPAELAMRPVPVVARVLVVTLIVPWLVRVASAIVMSPAEAVRAKGIVKEGRRKMGKRRWEEARNR